MHVLNIGWLLLLWVETFATLNLSDTVCGLQPAVKADFLQRETEQSLMSSKLLNPESYTDLGTNSTKNILLVFQRLRTGTPHQSQKIQKK